MSCLHAESLLCALMHAGLTCILSFCLHNFSGRPGSAEERANEIKIRLWSQTLPLYLHPVFLKVISCSLLRVVTPASAKCPLKQGAWKKIGTPQAGGCEHTAWEGGVCSVGFEWSVSDSQLSHSEIHGLGPAAWSPGHTRVRLRRDASACKTRHLLLGNDCQSLLSPKQSSGHFTNSDSTFTTDPRSRLSMLV